MRALQFERPGTPLGLVDVPRPIVEAGTALLRVTACGICGTDLHRTQLNSWTYAPGTIPGHEFAGEVVEVGGGVESLSVGTRVTAQPFLGCGRCASCLSGYPRTCPESRNIGNDIPGAFAEYVLVAPQFATPIPPEVTDADGALVEPLAVGLHGIRRGRVGPGDRVVVMGAGPVGLAALWWARRAGVDRVVVVASSRRRERIARAMGASDFLVNPETEQLASEVGRALGGIPSVVMECVGLPGAMQRSLELVGRRGRVISLGASADPEVIHSLTGLRNEVEIIFAACYDSDEFRLTVSAMEAGDVAPRAMVTRTIGLDEAPSMFEQLRLGGDQCKVLVDPSI